MAQRFDLYFELLSAVEQQTTMAFVTLGTSSSIGVKGFQQLINKWLKCFLTPRGSDATDLNYGTLFSNLIGSNISLPEARDISDLAVQQCKAQVYAMQANDLTLTGSERLADAKIINFIENKAAPGFELYIEIKNQAQEFVVLTIPTATS